eukprot:4771206-Pyramimonas_sp.AAC.1
MSRPACTLARSVCAHPPRAGTPSASLQYAVAGPRPRDPDVSQAHQGRLEIGTSPRKWGNEAGK